MNAIFRVKMTNGSPQFLKPAGLAESEPWSPDYWSIGNAYVDGLATGWATYQLNYMSETVHEATILDTDNYLHQSDVEG